MTTKIWLHIKNHKYYYLLALFFFALYSTWSINRHNHFLTDAVDLGIFDQPMWRWSQFKKPLSTIKYNQYPGEHLLGDHFHPILIPLSYLFWIWEDVRVLLLAQAFFVVAASLPIFLTAKKLLKSRLLALAITFSYLSFIGVQTAIDYDFHETALAALPLSVSLYALTFQKWRLFFASFLLGLLFKEDMPLMYGGLGLFAALKWGISKKTEQRKKYLVTSGLVLLISTAYYFLVTKIVIPYFKGAPWLYEELDPRIGETTTDLIKAGFTRPWVIFQVMFSPPLKLKTMINYLASFGFLPLLAPTSLIMLLPNFVSRFLTDLPQRWLLRYQYSVNIAPALSFGTIYGVSFLKKLRQKGAPRFKILKSFPLDYFLVFFLVFCSVFQTFRTNTPLFRMLNPKYYQNKKRYDLNRELLSKIPEKASVMAQSSFAPHLSHRVEIYRFEDGLVTKRKPDYVIMSAAESSDPPYLRKDLEAKIETLRQNPNYAVLYWDGVRLLMKRKD